MSEKCKIHEDVPYIVRESISVNGGHIGWGCAVCNMLKLEEARARIHKLEVERDGAIQAMGAADQRCARAWEENERLKVALREITRWKENQLDGIDSARIARAALESKP